MDNKASIIVPTVGRMVWFYPGTGSGDSGFARYNDGPFAATVAYVWNDRMVNLTVFDHGGVSHPRTSVPLRQEGDAMPSFHRCEWMPYQKGQAARTEAAEQLVGAGTFGRVGG